MRCGGASPALLRCAPINVRGRAVGTWQHLPAKPEAHHPLAWDAPAAVRAVFAQHAGGVYFNQVAISSKRAELQTLQEQIAQQQAANEEMQRILGGSSDEMTEWVARDSFNYAAPNERILWMSGNRSFHDQRLTRSIGFGD